MKLKFVVAALKGDLKAAMEENYAPIADAASAAMTDAADEIKRLGRADIASAGFSKRWQNALRADVYPKRAHSADAAALIHHRIPYADVFEAGANIRGKPLMWVPLPSTPKKIGRKKMSPKLFISEVGKLFPMPSKNGKRLLAANIPDTGRKRTSSARVSLSALRRGASGDGPVKAVPLFMGVPAVTVGKKFSLRQITDRAAAQLPQLYLKHFRAP